MSKSKVNLILRPKPVANLLIADKLAIILRKAGRVSLLVAFVLLSGYLSYSRLQDERSKFALLAKITANNLQGVVAFNDTQGAQQSLATLKAVPSVRFAELKNANGALIARFGNHTPDSSWLSWRYVDATQPVTIGNTSVGRLHINFELTDMWLSVGVNLVFLLLLLQAAIVVAETFARRLALSITQPISNLAETFKKVSSTGQYDLRATKETHDEVGVLVDGFNEMLDILHQRDSELRIAATTFNSHGAILITSADCKIIRANHAFEVLTGYTVSEVIGKNPNVLQSGKHDKKFYENLWHELLVNGVWSGEIWNRHKDGHIYPIHTNITVVKNDQGETSQYVSIFYDISDRKLREEEIHNLAFYDPLTNLPNRRMLLNQLEIAVSAAKRTAQYGVLMFLDLDNFKVLNDTMGHDYGDLMLQEVASRLKLSTRETDIVARLGGDEFVVLFENLGHDENTALNTASHIAEKIRSVLATDYQLKEFIHHSSSSIGICLHHGEISAEDILKYADIAMYQAKSSGRNMVRNFDPKLQEAVESRAALERDMTFALKNKQFQLYYQLQVDHTGKVTGAESLIRWQSPTRGMVPPADFIPVAEENGFIIDIGEWVLETACRQLQQWQTLPGFNELSIAVNVSGNQFQLPTFVDLIENVIKKYEINPALLKLELTEAIALGDIESVRAKLLALRHDLHVKLSLDDFGTGYSSLSYLKQLPVDQLKIDRSFVQDMHKNPDDALMVKTIINLSTNFGLKTIAEGVEMEEHVNMLKKFGCDEFQGYFYARPLPLNEFEALIENLENMSFPPNFGHRDRLG